MTMLINQFFAGPGTSAPVANPGEAVWIQTSGVSVTVEGSNHPEDAGSWQACGTASGEVGTRLACSYGWIRFTAAGPGRVSAAGRPQVGTSQDFRTTTLLSSSALATGSSISGRGTAPSFTAQVTGTGAVSATVVVEGGNGQGWVTLGSITLSGSTSVTDGFAMPARYQQYRARLTAISGASALAIVVMGD